MYCLTSQTDGRGPVGPSTTGTSSRTFFGLYVPVVRGPFGPTGRLLHVFSKIDALIY